MVYVYALFILLFHLSVPIILITLSLKFFQKKVRYIFVCIIVIVSIASYFVGIYTSSPVRFSSQIGVNDYSKLETKDNYFLFTNKNGYEYSGKVYCFNKNEYSDDLIIKLLNDEGLFQTKMNNFGKTIIKQDSLHSTLQLDDSTIDISPIVLSTNSMVLERNVYRGYIQIERENKVFVIVYEVWFLDNAFNYFTFMQIYSNKKNVEINEFIENLMSYEEYNDLIYSPI